MGEKSAGRELKPLSHRERGWGEGKCEALA